MLAYLQYDKELFASWLWHTPLTCLSGPDPSPIRHSCDILGPYPFPAATFPEFEL